MNRQLRRRLGVALACTCGAWTFSGWPGALPRGNSDPVLLAQAAVPSAPQSASSGNPKDQRPTFRGGANFVYVDVYPRRDGKVVEGLTATDFQVFEDGKPQTVELFEYLKSEPNTPDAERRDPNSQQDSERQAADPRNRVFVVYLDLYHTTVIGSHDARRPITEFLNRTISATDVFGVITPEVPVGQLVFGRRTETVEAELSKFWTWGQQDRAVMDRTPMERQLSQCLRGDAPALGELLIRLHREDLLLENLENLMVRLRDLKDERKNVLFISEGWVPQNAHPELASIGVGALPVVGRGASGTLGIGNVQPGSRDDSWCDRQLGRLANTDFAQRFRELLSTARRANVSFFPVDVGGLKTGGGTGAAATLRTLAENTDGFAVLNTNDVVGAVRRVADSLAGYYLLGYYSTNQNADGRFREIEVKTKQPRLSVSARRGYLAPTAAMIAAAAAPAPGPSPASKALEEELGRLARLRPEADLFTYGVTTPDRLDLVVELGSREMERGRWASGADVRLAVTSPGAAEVPVSGRIEAGARAVLLHVPLGPGQKAPWRVRVRVSGEGGQLEDRIELMAAADELLGPPLISRATPSPRSVLKPVADFQFRRTERLHAEWAALKPLDTRTVRVLDRRGQPLPQGPTLSEGAPDAAKILIVDLNMSGFAEGDYVLEVTAGAGPERERKLLAFRVVR